MIGTVTERHGWRINIATPRSPSFRNGDLDDPGLGGNESTCVLWSRELARRGHDVAIYVPGIDAEYSAGCKWYPLNQWGLRQADVAIAMRDPRPLMLLSNQTIRVLYLGDRRTQGIDCLQPGRDIDMLWCNSQYQIALHEKTFQFPMPIVSGCCGFDEALFYPDQKPLNAPLRFLHSSVPYRGLAPLLELWPVIRRALSDSELHITGGYTLWGYSSEDAQDLLNKDIQKDRLKQPGIVYHGALTRKAYADVVRRSNILLYPTNYEETCCIAVLEASAAGVVPVVSAVGALTERVRDRLTGVTVEQYAGPSEFAEAAIKLARDSQRLAAMSAAAASSAREFSIGRVVDLLVEAIRSCETGKSEIAAGQM